MNVWLFEFRYFFKIIKYFENNGGGVMLWDGVSNINYNLEEKLVINKV